VKRGPRPGTRCSVSSARVSAGKSIDMGETLPSCLEMFQRLAHFRLRNVVEQGDLAESARQHEAKPAAHVLLVATHSGEKFFDWPGLGPARQAEPAQQLVLTLPDIARDQPALLRETSGACHAGCDRLPVKQGAVAADRFECVREGVAVVEH